MDKQPMVVAQVAQHYHSQVTRAVQEAVVPLWVAALYRADTAPQVKEIPEVVELPQANMVVVVVQVLQVHQVR
jgi:hypothetical protein